jgi:hypothetical protein
LRTALRDHLPGIAAKARAALGDWLDTVGG